MLKLIVMVMMTMMMTMVPTNNDGGEDDHNDHGERDVVDDDVNYDDDHYNLSVHHPHRHILMIRLKVGMLLLR